MKNDTSNKVILILFVLLISAIFLRMIMDFLMVIFLAGLFSATAQPVYRRFERWFKGRRSMSAAATLVFILLILFIPLGGILGIVAGQAIKISHSVTPWITKTIQEPSAFDDLFKTFPFYDTLITYKEIIFQKAGELVGKMSSILFNSLSSATLSTIHFLFLFFVFLYTMFFFLKDGNRILDKILYYSPLSDVDEQRMLEKFTSVTRATIKGTLLIGVIQGSLAGLGFWIVGIDSALFWGTIMTVLSIIPAVGSALVWIPAAIILAASGSFVKAISLLAYCGILAGSVDNLLRPRLVGKDTKLHELFIFFGTLGGISLFGIIGFIVGTILVDLFCNVLVII